MDLSYNIYSFDIIKILPPNVSYMNTSIEEWEENNNSVIESLKFRQDDFTSLDCKLIKGSFISGFFTPAEYPVPNDITLDLSMKLYLDVLKLKD